MCHLIFVLPLAGIPLFWALPLGYVLPINVLLWIVCGWLGHTVLKDMKLPAQDNFKSLIGTEAMVVSADSQGYGQYLIKAGHELWTARSTNCLQPGERVTVVATEGIKLIVKRSDEERTEETVNERYCH